MTKIIIIEDENDSLSDAITALIEGASSDKPDKASKSKDNDKDDSDGDEKEYTSKDIKTMCDELKELTSAKELKEVLEEFDVTTAAKAAKLEDEDLQDCGADLADAIADAKDGNPDGDEIDIEAVKAAVQAYTKENGKKDTLEILKEYNIKSVKSLDKLDQDELEELFEEVSE